MHIDRLHRQGRAAQEGPLHQGSCREGRAIAVVDLFQIKDIPEGREIQRIQSVAAAINARPVSNAPPPSSASPTSCSPTLPIASAPAPASTSTTSSRLPPTCSRAATRPNGCCGSSMAASATSCSTKRRTPAPPSGASSDAITDDIFAGAGAVRDEAQRTLFVVGDQKQSIYSFQGADPEHFLTRSSRSSSNSRRNGRAGASLPDLAMSFRSAPEVLSYVDEVFDTAAFDARRALHDQPARRRRTSCATRPSGAAMGSVELWPLEPKADVTQPAVPWDAPQGDGERRQRQGASRRPHREASSRAKSHTGAAVWDKAKQRPCKPRRLPHPRARPHRRVSSTASCRR